jgi:hypothetical protein
MKGLRFALANRIALECAPIEGSHQIKKVDANRLDDGVGDTLASITAHHVISGWFGEQLPGTR